MTAKAEFQWTITPHCCRICFSRVLKRVTVDRRTLHRCSSCGAEVEGSNVAGLCACGITLAAGKGRRDAGIRCVVNTHRTPENPAEIVAEQVDVSQLQQSNTVGT